MLAVFWFQTLLKTLKRVCSTLAVRKREKKVESFHRFLLVQQCYGAAEIPPTTTTTLHFRLFQR